MVVFPMPRGDHVSTLGPCRQNDVPTNLVFAFRIFINIQSKLENQSKWQSVAGARRRDDGFISASEENSAFLDSGTVEFKSFDQKARRDLRPSRDQDEDERQQEEEQKKRKRGCPLSHNESL
ncbi:hypothetical protein EYF80_043397 [Liparis tanakae]|uniref:Uncharacterized protein n=1 Tax=Liparis tanakae TaxID=230148 RepID=A0A4Z2FYL9_9TELE|nr:hypothetical protein EYF80_043397 [Liparis tanakae]